MTTAVAKGSVLQKLVEQANSLYSLPAIAIDVLQLTEQPKVDVAALKACIEQDPALTCKLLRVVNSSLFGLSCKVSDLNQALTLLGVKPLKLLVLSFSLPPSLFSGVEAETLRRYWRFTLIKATAARQLSSRFWELSEDEAFIAGLLQEIGSLVLIQQLGSAYVQFLTVANQQERNICELEVETLGFDHTVLSARLLEHWRLPQSLVNAVARPYDSKAWQESSDQDADLPQILHLASLIAAIIVDGRHDLTAELLAVGKHYRGICQDQFSELLDEIQHRVDLLADLFSVTLNDEESYRDILLRAHRQLSEAAAEAVPDVVTTAGADVLYQHQQMLGSAAERLQQGLPPQKREKAVGAGVQGSAAACPPSSSTVESRVSGVQDQRFLGAVSKVLGQGRLHRCDVSLLLLEIGGFDRLLVQSGPDRAAQVVDSMLRGIREFADPQAECLLVTDSRWAILMVDCECREAVGYARRLVERMPSWLIEQRQTSLVLEFRAGVASAAYPGRHFSPEQVVESAERCLFAAASSGLQTVKSIDLV
jgi:HD-like signal output (HDOD) protein